MDKEKAQFILTSFRANGRDSADTDFQEALKLAVENRELGEWLADERAEDAKFAAALNEIEIPDDLRLNLLALMNGDAVEDPQLHQEMDQMLSSALADVQPPVGLRDQILAAMEVETKEVVAQETPAEVITGVFNRKKWINVAAVAAAVALGVFFAFQVNSVDEQQAPLASYEVQQSAGQLLNTSFSLDMKNDNSTYLSSWLKEQDLPSPANVGDLPPGLQKLPSMGCKKIDLPGEEQASLICYLTEAKKSLHLIVVRNDVVNDKDLPTLENVNAKNCYHCPLTDWNAVRWRDKENTYILMSKSGASQKEDLVQYF